MKIELAKHSGFCLGVRNAILKMVDEINASNDEIYVYGPLIHNPQTITVLQKRGLKTIENLSDIKNKQIAVRTHGITNAENKKIKSSASRIINLTCPRVARVQSLIKKYSSTGYFTIILGDEKHAEVIGLKSYAISGVKVIAMLDDIDNIPSMEKYLLVSQTTLDRDLFDKIVRILQQKFEDILIIDTICNSTKNRQVDVKNGIARGIDTLVVVGGKNSANTKRLARIGEEHNIKTLYVESEDEINYSDFKNSEYILVTAGASTPGWIINNVLEKLYDVKFKKANFIINIIKNVLEFVVRTSLLSSVAAFFFSLLLQYFAGITYNYRLSLIAFIYIFSMYSINNYFDRDFLKTCNSNKFKIYDRFGIPLVVLSILSMIISIKFSYDSGITIFMVLISSYIFGIAYSTDYVKYIIKMLHLSILRKIYNSKIITYLGWLYVIIFLPSIIYPIDIYEIINFSIFILSIIFFRHFLIDVIAFQSDLIFGRETIPVLIGVKNITILAIIISFLSILTLVAFAFLRNNMLILIFSINIIYYYVLLNKIKNANYLISLKYEVLVDFNFILMIFFFYITTS